MTWLYIVGPIVLLAVVLFGDIVLKIGYDGDFRLTVRYLFLKKTLFPKPEKKPGKEKGVKEKKVKQAGGGNPVSFSGIIGALGEIKRVLGDILKKTRVKPCMLKIKVATGDAAQTAIAYGGCCAGLAAFEAVMTNTFGSFKGDFGVFCDYDGDKWAAEAKIVVRLRPIWIVGAAFGALARYIKYPDKGLHLLVDPPQSAKKDKPGK